MNIIIYNPTKLAFNNLNMIRNETVVGARLGNASMESSVVGDRCLSIRSVADQFCVAGFPPIFKEKLHDKAYDVGDSCTMPVHVIAKPHPIVTWYRNDESLTDGGRIRTTEAPLEEDGGHYRYDERCRRSEKHSKDESVF